MFLLSSAFDLAGDLINGIVMLVNQVVTLVNQVRVLLPF